MGVGRQYQMSLSEARMALARKEFGEPPDSQNYLFASGVLAAREANEREAAQRSIAAATKTTKWYTPTVVKAIISTSVAAIIKSCSG